MLPLARLMLPHRFCTRTGYDFVRWRRSDPVPLDRRDRSARHTPSDLPGQLPLRSMAQLARTVDGAKLPPPRGRVCLDDWTALASCFSGGLLPTESWAPCGRLYAYADPIPPKQKAARACLQKTDAKRHLRSTGADTRLSSNHGSNERSPLRRNFQPRRWLRRIWQWCSLQLKEAANAAAAGPSRPNLAVAAPLVHG